MNRESVSAPAVLTVVLFAACGLGHSLLFPPANLGALAFVFLVPGLWACTRPSRLRSFLLIQFLGGMVSWSFLLVWLRHAHPLAAAGIPALAGVMALFWTAWWAAARSLVPLIVNGGFLARLLAVLALGAGWALLEWIRSWFLTGFPWLPLAASQWLRPVFLQPAEWMGGWGVSGMLVSANAALFSWLWRLVQHAREGWRRLCPEFYLACLALVGCGALGIRELSSIREVSAGRIALVQPDVPQSEKWDPEHDRDVLAKLESVHRVAAATRPDLVIWPEAVLPYALKTDPYLASWTQSAADLAGAPVLLGTIDILPGKDDASTVWRNAAALVLPGGASHDELYIKRKLVPFGEYVPLRSLLGSLAKLVPIGGDFQRGSEAVAFPVPAPGGRILRYAPLICYEDLFPVLSAKSVESGADVLVVLTNNGWFGREAFAHQHAAHSVLRAVETRRAVVRCGNAGWSGWIDSWGRRREVLSEVGTGSVYFRGSSTFEVRVDERWLGRETFYVRHHRWVPAIAALLLLAGLMAARRRSETA